MLLHKCSHFTWELFAFITAVSLLKLDSLSSAQQKKQHAPEPRPAGGGHVSLLH